MRLRHPKHALFDGFAMAERVADEQSSAVCRSHSALQDQLRTVTAVLASNEGLAQLLETSQDCINTNATLNIINGSESLKLSGLLR